METIYWLISYVVIINIIAFIVMGIDKWKAKKRAWRIPEATLFILAGVGGSIGSIAGMYLFRHKTKHRSFTWGMPAILIIQIILIALLFFLPGEIKLL
ncbi:MAG: DUF1294 domain-containing protein [Lachnospiraceae bacterium]|nr:DUF1294 domain-containing protein [Lachnospiraceae bacterium]